MSERNSRRSRKRHAKSVLLKRKQNEKLSESRERRRKRRRASHVNLIERADCNSSKLRGPNVLWSARSESSRRESQKS